jgi:hypothetical protein
MTPRPWQEKPIETLTSALKRGQSALDASDTGTGKTLVALMAAKNAGLSLGVICPIACIPSWVQTAEAVGVDLDFVGNVEALKRSPSHLIERRAIRKGVSKVVGYQWVAKPGAFVYDEVHRFSSSTSQNAMILAATPKPVLMLSATAASDPTKMRAIAHQLGLSTWRSWWEWCGENGCRRGYFGGIEFKGDKAVLDRLHRQIFHTGRGVRVSIADLGDAFPKNTVETIVVPVEKQKALDEAYAEELRTKEMDAETAGAARTHARQVSEHLKLPALCELIEDTVAQGRSVVVGVGFIDSVKRIVDEFNAAQIHGGQVGTERADNIREFAENRKQVIVLTKASGGAGLDGLQDLTGDRPRTSYSLPGDSAIDEIQFKGRIHRGNARTPSQHYFVFADNALEARIRRNVERKKGNIETLVDGDLFV